MATQKKIVKLVESNAYAEKRTALIPFAVHYASSQVAKSSDSGSWSVIFCEEMDRLAHADLGAKASWIMRLPVVDRKPESR